MAEQAQHAEAAARAHAQELTRFNRVAVERESRMIEMKKELNDLFARHGEAVPYPLEFEHEGTAGPPE